MCAALGIGTAGASTADGHAFLAADIDRIAPDAVFVLLGANDICTWDGNGAHVPIDE